jgi:hypothetical protein
MFPASKSFPTVFYATAATIIPVLFLAIAVQGRIYESIVTRAADYIRSAKDGWTSYQKFAAVQASALIMALAGILLVGAVFGEILALFLLGRGGSDTSGERNFVMSSTAVLVIAAGIPAVGVFVRGAIRVNREFKESPWRRTGKRAESQGDSSEGTKHDQASPPEEGADGADESTT